MTMMLTELKTRARLLRNVAKRQGGEDELRLKDCLNQTSRDVGFAHWDHARRVLGGEAVPGEDMGSFWHAPRSGILLNLWFARYDEARAALRDDPAAYLLPYRRQFFLVQSYFILELGLDPEDAAWREAGHDLVQAYGSAAWRALAVRRLQAPRNSFA